jgi:small-conductance mechanosensitive channel
MKFIEEIFDKEWLANIMYSVLTIIIFYIFYKMVSIFLKRREKGFLKDLFSNKTETYLRLIRNAFKYIVILIVVLIILRIYGINITSIVAGVGIISIIIGFAVQDWLKDIIRGSNILSDGYFSVGDVVKYKDIEGKVLVLGLKTTKIQDLATSNIISIANRNIEEIELVSKYVYVRVPMPYEIDLNKSEKAINDIISIALEYDNVKTVNYLGVAELADSSIQYLLQIECNPKNKLQVRRNILRSILVGLEKNNISVPYNQIDIHEKK